MFLKGELCTRLFLATCLKLLDVLLGPSPTVVEVEADAESSEGVGDGFNGEEEVLSRLLICRGDHPLAEDDMIESRAAFEAAEPLWRLRRAAFGEGEGCGEDMSGELQVAGSGVRTVNGMLSKGSAAPQPTRHERQ
jgi:hypothetical protein